MFVGKGIFRAMKVAFDVDGVITEAPAFFAALARALRAVGHEVHIISDFDDAFREQRIQELEGYGIDYDHFVTISNKAEYCTINGIDFAIDDDAIEYFSGFHAVPIALIRIRTGTDEATD